MSPRMSAAERREQVIKAAMAEFARRGFEGTSTTAIAGRVGVSQPYLFRLFPSKHAIVLAAVERCFDVMEAEMRDAAGGLYGDEAFAAMGTRYREMLVGDHAALQFQLQIYAAALEDEAIREVGERRWAGLWKMIGEISGGDPQRVTDFVAYGMLLNVLTAFGIPVTFGATAESLRDWARDRQ
ncbi:TetR/AcrR family transcriptional regulator [Actinomadura parmotrematis]|uniref:TetR/AcrR family transcriptional regulator n=1 Tax=Actinomadura parmotrematis TaxID=2864039 RepID=A0ABS7FXH7_9ACTN|nr:TetR/AcrR family transcriptional regulator [Actinomadura parmotrematis]MBW8485136.1 TetR/AcrR family transcriptional regulator [Actinomadura parmotrematis]